MADFSLAEFKSQVLGKGLARTNRFEVTISSPPKLASSYTRTVSLLCEQASLPLLNVNTKSHRIYGPAYPRPVTSEYGGEGLPLTFHVDREMNVKRFFDDWIHLIINKNNFNVSYSLDYLSSIIINQLDEADNITYSVAVEDAFPRSINLMELNHAAQSQTHRLTVLFAYRKWAVYDSKNPGGVTTTTTLDKNKLGVQGSTTSQPLSTTETTTVFDTSYV